MRNPNVRVKAGLYIRATNKGYVWISEGSMQGQCCYIVWPLPSTCPNLRAT